MCCLCIPLSIHDASHIQEQSFRLQFPEVLIYDELAFLTFADTCHHMCNSTT